MEENSIDFAAELEDYVQSTLRDDLSSYLDEDEQLKKDTIQFLIETGTNFDQIIYGAVGLGVYLVQRLWPGDYDYVNDNFCQYWIESLNIHEGMTGIIDAALERAKSRIDADIAALQSCRTTA